MIEDLGRHKSEETTRDEWAVDKAFKSPVCWQYGVYEIRQFKKIVFVKIPRHCIILIGKIVSWVTWILIRFS